MNVDTKARAIFAALKSAGVIPQRTPQEPAVPLLVALLGAFEVVERERGA